MKNENKTDEIVDILTHLQQYVPKVESHTVVKVPNTEKHEVMVTERLHHLLIGGDQLTAERVRGAQSMRQNSTHAMGRLEGYIPVSEDWHAKVCFLQVQFLVNQIIHGTNTIVQVIWKHFYKKGDAFSEACTMPQLKSLINRTNVPLHPKNDVNAAEDFLEVQYLYIIITILHIHCHHYRLP